MANPFFLWILPLALGFFLDLCIGDPYFLPHPIRLIGWLIDKGEKVTRRILPKTKGGELCGGAIMAMAVCVICFLVPWLILWGAYLIHPIVCMGMHTLFCYQILAVKSLKDESMKVEKGLLEKDTEKARFAVSMIVGRDTQALSEEGMIKAAVETVAENTADGTVAPLLFMALGGAPLGFLYKAVNTMDSMIGYRNQRYLYFGRFAARMDDVLNFIPARVAAIFMIVAAFFTGLDGKNAMKIFVRDRLNHASPNSGQTEAVCAGALQVMLAGNAVYFGKLYEKKTIGDDRRPVAPGDIHLACRLLYGTAGITFAICMIGMVGVQWLF
ncbi:MAG: adenosylcobinamide-phosphate synthase CbiB [Anaerovorax sp.]